jgi:hydrogenase nickel incorporation protein HypA/HybF
MHEMSIAEGILLTLEAEGKKHQFNKVKKVWLEVGRFAGVEISALTFAWDVVTRDSIASGAVLEIIEQTGVAWCLFCGENKNIEQRYDSCPDCGSNHLQMISGDELKIKEIEVD